MILGMIQLTTLTSLQRKADATRILFICAKNAASVFTQIRLWCVLRCIIHVYKSTVFRKLLFLYTYEIFWKVIVNFLIFLLSLNYFVSIYFLFYNLFSERDYIYADMLFDFMLPKRLTFESKWMKRGLYTLELELPLFFD